MARGCCAWLRRDSCPHVPQALWAASSFPVVGGNGLQSFSLLRCFSWLAPVPPKNHKAKGYTCSSWASSPTFFLFFFLINMQVLSAQGTIQERFQPPPVSLAPFSWLHYLIFFFFFKYCIRKMALSSLPLCPGLSAPHHPHHMVVCMPALPQASTVALGQHCCRHLNHPQVAFTHLYKFLGVWVWIFFSPSI